MQNACYNTGHCRKVHISCTAQKKAIQPMASIPAVASICTNLHCIHNLFDLVIHAYVEADFDVFDGGGNRERQNEGKGGKTRSMQDQAWSPTTTQMIPENTLCLQQNAAALYLIHSRTMMLIGPKSCLS